MPTTTSTFDAERAEAFAGRLVGAVNDGALAVMVSIGHQTGLFDAMGGLEPSTSDAIASAAGLHERYVREWLGAMVTGGVVEHDPDAGTYVLPAEHGAFLTRAAGPENLATVTQFIPMLAEVEQQIVECFRNGGGVPYSAFPRFHALMAENSAQDHDALLVDHVVPLVDGLPARLADGIDVLDIGCGQGHAVNLLAAAFPASRVTGYDVSEEAITEARKEAANSGLTNATFEVRDVARLDDDARFDLVTAFDAIHDQADPAGALASVHRALRPGGVFLCADIKASSHVAENVEHPMATFLYTVSTMHCMTVSLAEGGTGLGNMWGHQLAVSMIEEAGFTDVSVQEVEGDAFNFYYVARKA